MIYEELSTYYYLNYVEWSIDIITSSFIVYMTMHM